MALVFSLLQTWSLSFCSVVRHNWSSCLAGHRRSRQAEWRPNTLSQTKPTVSSRSPYIGSELYPTAPTVHDGQKSIYWARIHTKPAPNQRPTVSIWHPGRAPIQMARTAVWIKSVKPPCIPFIVQSFAYVKSCQVTSLISPSPQKSTTSVLLYATHRISVPTHHLPTGILHLQSCLLKQQHFELSAQLQNPWQGLIRIVYEPFG